jgi:hypothetical protein
MPVWHGTNGLDPRYSYQSFASFSVGIIRNQIFRKARISPLCSVTGYSVSDPDSIRSVDPDSESGSGRAKMTHINRKVKKFHVLNCWMVSFEG